MIKFRVGRKIVAYIREDDGKYIACTGKPSDRQVLSWEYTLLENAVIHTHDFMRRYVQNGTYTMDGVPFRVVNGHRAEEVIEYMDGHAERRI